jgi:hypothetical protein
MNGVGFSFSRPFAWQVRPALYAKAHRGVSADRVKQLISTLREATLSCVDLSIVHETKVSSLKLNVQSGHLVKVASSLNGSSTCLHTTTKPEQALSLEMLGCKDGIASPASTPDGYFLSDLSALAPPFGAVGGAALGGSAISRLVCGVWEVKHSTDSPEVSLPQAFSESTNIALSHARAGVPARDVCVPVVSSNGRLIQFALCTMLPPAFPYLVVLTKVLDLCDEEDCKEAAIQLCAVEQVCMLMHLPAPTLHPSSVQFGLSLHDFHLKLTKDIFKTRSTLDQSLLHMFSVFQRLWNSPHQKRVLFPLTFRCGKSPSEDTLVFDRLHDYRIGLPADETVRQALLELLESSLRGFHECGVVHMDFYPSNFMWRQASDGTIDLKVIDWDAAHLVNEPFAEFVRNRLVTTGRLKLCPHEAGLCALPVVDIVLLDVLKTYQTDSRLLSDQKADLDDAFRILCKSFLLRRQMLPDAVAEGPSAAIDLKVDGIGNALSML